MSLSAASKDGGWLDGCLAGSSLCGVFFFFLLFVDDVGRGDCVLAVSFFLFGQRGGGEIVKGFAAAHKLG